MANEDHEVCIRCKHRVDEHVFNKEVGLVLCSRVTQVKNGRPYQFCSCSIFDKGEKYNGEINGKLR